MKTSKNINSTLDDKNELCILTEDILNKGKSKNGGYSKKQLELIGINWPPIKGWKKKCYSGNYFISSKNILKFISLKDKHIN